MIEPIERWNIRVAGYGTFELLGTETEAEEMRRHKSRWEGGVGHKYRLENQTEVDRLTQTMCAKWDSGEGVSPTLMKEYRAALSKAATP